MSGLLFLVAAASIGIDYGWQPGDDGRLEYIIQIEPSLLGALKPGTVLSSEIHPDARGVRRFRVQVGTDELPRDCGMPTSGQPPLGLDVSADSGEPPVESPTLLERPGSADGAVLDYAEAEPAVSGDSGSSEPRPEDSSAADRSRTELGTPLPPPSKPAADRSTMDGFQGDSDSRSRWGISDSPGGSGPIQPPPQPFDPERAAEPLLNQQISYAEPAESITTGTQPERAVSTQPDTLDASTGPVSNPVPPAKPWLPLALALFGLFGSLGGNVYLGWIAWGARRRYQALAGETSAAHGPESSQS